MPVPGSTTMLAIVVIAFMVIALIVIVIIIIVVIFFGRAVVFALQLELTDGIVNQ